MLDFQPKTIPSINSLDLKFWHIFKGHISKLKSETERTHQKRILKGHATGAAEFLLQAHLSLSDLHILHQSRIGAFNRPMNMFEFLRKSTAACALSAATAAWWYRPERDNGNGPIRSRWMSSINVHDNTCAGPPLMLHVAQHITLFISVALPRLYLNIAGKFTIIDNDHYAHFVEAGLRRDKKTPLITVSNHTSLIDDPCVLASILPLPHALIPKYVRWSICTQDICYPKNDFLAAYFGSGQTLPICRGAGINQSLLLHLARHVATGEWAHVFPEGGVYQYRTKLGGRDTDKTPSIGKLKWGTAKLIAHAPESPIVIPFYFSGMEDVIPLHPITRAIISVIPVPGHNICVRFGAALKFDDLIHAHEEKYGKLRKYRCSSSAQVLHNDMLDEDSWVSTESDKLLYHKITNRIEEVLERLRKEAYNEIENNDRNI